MTLAEQKRQLWPGRQAERSYLDRLGHSRNWKPASRRWKSRSACRPKRRKCSTSARSREATRARYGDSDFGRGCLMALRLVERGVRMVQVYFGNFQPWDSHDDIRVHAKLAHAADGPIAALIDDLKAARAVRRYAADRRQRIWPHADDPKQRAGEGLQRPRPQCAWLHARCSRVAASKVASTYGATDDFGFKAVEKPCHVHDLHATILHLMGSITRG